MKEEFEFTDEFLQSPQETKLGILSSHNESSVESSIGIRPYPVISEPGNINVTSCESENSYKLMKMDGLKNDEMLSQDPDYKTLFKADLNRQNVFENNARTNASNKISTIIEAEFLKEIESKKVEILNIYNNLNKACKMLHYLRFAIVTDFYNQENTCIHDTQNLKQTRPHPTINSSIKKLPNAEVGVIEDCFEEFKINKKQKRKNTDENSDELPGLKKKCSENIYSKNTVVPHMLNTNVKMKRRLIIGNISKWIPPDFRDDNASHKWTVYIRDSEKCDVGKFISKVRFFLHPSYKPNDVIELTSPPFHLSRFGWGEFPVRVQLHFSNSCDKPVDIIHNLKLDRTFTGLQTIGSETVVDIWITSMDTAPTENFNECNEENFISKNETCINSNSTNETSTNSNSTNETSTNLNSTNKTSINSNTTTCHALNDHDYLKNNSSLLSNHITEVSQTNDLKCANKDVNKTENQINANEKQENKELLTIESFRNFSSENKFNDVENIRTLISSIGCAKFGNLFSILKFITRRMPLITEQSVDSSYKIKHPYACGRDEFYKFSKIKQYSMERCRAKYVLDIVKDVKDITGNSDICTIKEFIIWARRYCYTPFMNFNINNLAYSENLQNFDQYRSTSTICHDLNEWLLQCQNINPSTENLNDESDEEIDVDNLPVDIPNSSHAENDMKFENKSVVLMEYPETENSLKEFINKTAQSIGIKLTNEEIIPGISHCTANVLMTTAVECLIDEMIRLSFSCALDRCKYYNEKEIAINVEDVRMALLKKEELDIFTNAGLGSHG